ncbi:MAG: FG-GAP repeat protein, partial [Planctomycetes bacterium]|nr:FG-GAP repeat protein [Planctomycetota bacterium]
MSSRGLIIGLCLLFLVLSMPAQVVPLRLIEGGQSGDAMGAAVAGLGDVDGDGVADILVGLPGADGGGVDAGQARVYSGATAGLLRSVDGLAAGDRFGTTVAALGDLDGDGVAEYAVSAPYSDGLTGLSDVGEVWIFSGSNGALMTRLSGAQSNDDFGRSMADVGDLDGDGIPDFVIGVPGFDFMGGDVGEVCLYSGASRTRINLVIRGSAPNDEFGHSVAGLGDVDGDLVPDLIVGAHLGDGTSPFSNVGYVRIVSGVDGSTIDTIVGAQPIGLFGSAVARAGDLDADGVEDFIVAARLHDANGVDSGRVFIYSGATRINLHMVDGEVAGDQLGTSIAGNFDFDGDGTPDYAMGSSTSDHASTNAGRVLIHSGADHLLLLAIDGAEPGARSGAALSLAGDLDGDGLGELVIGAPEEDDLLSIDTGRVRVYSLRDPSVIIHHDGVNADDRLGERFDVLGDLNGDGAQDYIVSARLADVSFANAGAVHIVSGADGSLVMPVIDGFQAASQLGTSVAGPGDVNGDGTPDFATGAPAEDAGMLVKPGRVHLHSGVDGSILFSIDGTQDNEQFGIAMAAIGDLDGDGVSDLAIGAFFSDPPDPTTMNPLVNAGRVYLHSGANGALIRMIDGTTAGDRFGGAVDGVGDIDGDGVPDLIVGTANASAGSGRVSLISGIDGSLIRMHGG